MPFTGLHHGESPPLAWTLLVKLRVLPHCYFCRDQLKTVPLEGVEPVLLVFGLRHYYCPHCFQISTHTGSWLAVLLWPFQFTARFLNWMLD